MIVAHYAHRLPADYDTGLIRARAEKRGVLWDDVPQLYFKGFLLRQSGQYGAIANSYSSLYLWQQDDAFRDFLTSGQYGVVTDAFGRAEIQTWFALDACKGKASGARFAYKQDVAIPLDADLQKMYSQEIERNRDIAGQAGTVAAVVGVDPKNWSFTRIRLSTEIPGEDAQDGVAYEILHLAQPHLDLLPEGSLG